LWRSSSQYDDALVLCSLNRGKINEMDHLEYKRKECSIHLSYAHYLYKQREFLKCHNEYLLSKCDSRVVLSLFEPLLPEGVDFSDFSCDIGGRQSTKSKNSGSGGDVGGIAVKEIIDKSAITNLLIPFLIHVRTKMIESDRKGKGEKGEAKDDNLDFRHPNPTSVRVSRANTMPVHLDEVIDTVLLKAYIFTNAPLVDVVDFLTGGEDGIRWLECRALVDESEYLLSGIAEKWEELIWFYFSKGLHQKALDWLEDAHGERNRKPFPNIEQRAVKTVEYLQRLLEHVGMEMLRGDNGSSISGTDSSFMSASVLGKSFSLFFLFFLFFLN
jgi:hypothetical protein